jgi:hypothetical protein
MLIKHSIRVLPLIIIAMHLPALVPAQQSQLTAIHIDGPVYMIQGSNAGNIGIIVDSSGVIAIETMMANNANTPR